MHGGIRVKDFSVSENGIEIFPAGSGILLL
jgi:hypothetical protein